MENLFYVPIEKLGDEYFQNDLLGQDDLYQYHVSIFNNVIKKHFTEKQAVVNLLTGKYLLSVFVPKVPELETYFCIVNEDNFPGSESEISLTDDMVKLIRERLSLKVTSSEGIVADQKINVLTSFVTPRLKFSGSEFEDYYHHSKFNKSLFIFGAPGSGKTTILRRLTIDYLNNDLEVGKNKLNKLPIYIQLRDFNNYNYDFSTFIENSIKNSISSLNLWISDKKSSESKLYLMLDGADEIDFDKFQMFEQTITSYKRDNPLISIIITCRPDKKYEAISGFEKCWVQPFNENQVKELTYRKLTKSNKWKEFFSILKIVPDVLEILTNPLLLTLSHFLFLHKSILPTNTGQLLKELVATLVSNWDAQRNIERKLDNKIISPIEITHTLGQMAYVLLESGKQEIETKELFNKISNYDSALEFETYLQYIQFSTGIINSNNGRWYFLHKSIQEYFCSTLLVESVGELKSKVFREDNWGSILQMISGLSSDPGYIIENIKKQEGRNEINKLETILSFYKESMLLTKNDVKTSYVLLESFFLKFEEANTISTKNITLKPDEVILYTAATNNNLSQILPIFKILLYYVRFSKYEIEFYSYLKQSKSKILQSISGFTLRKGNISIRSSSGQIALMHEDESPEIDD